MLSFVHDDAQRVVGDIPAENSCKEYLFWHRGRTASRCPRCGKTETVYNINQPWKWDAPIRSVAGNAYRFSLSVGTIFENTKYPLRTWFEVLWAMLNSKKGISSMQVQRQIRSSYPTALYMTHRLRAAIHDPDFKQLMEIVEIDETAIGGKDKNRHRDKKQHIRGISGKTTVIGAISRKGNVVCQVIERANAATLSGFVKKAVSSKVELVATDEHLGYDRRRSEGYPHSRVTHSEGEYVRGKVHTDWIEGFGLCSSAELSALTTT